MSLYTCIHDGPHPCSRLYEPSVCKRAPSSLVKAGSNEAERAHSSQASPLWLVSVTYTAPSLELG